MSTTTFDQLITEMVQLAQYEGEMLVALAWQNLGLDDLDREEGEPPHSMLLQFGAMLPLGFEQSQGRYSDPRCEELLSELWVINQKLNPFAGKYAAEKGYLDGKADLAIARLEAI